MIDIGPYKLARIWTDRAGVELSRDWHHVRDLVSVTMDATRKLAMWSQMQGCVPTGFRLEVVA
jgi:hypothetical protein